MTETPVQNCRPRLLGPWRTTIQWLCTLATLGVPFVRIDGHSLLRLDFPSLTLWAGGRALPIESLSLMLPLGLALILFFLLVTLAFGRAWCGWGVITSYSIHYTKLYELVTGRTSNCRRSRRTASVPRKFWLASMVRIVGRSVTNPPIRQSAHLLCGKRPVPEALH